MSEKETVAEAIGIETLMRQATKKAESASKLNPVFLRRESFAKTAISTGSLCLDWKMGGGIPPARIVGISGPERAGKTLLVTQILFNQVSSGGFAKLYDAEGSTDPLFLKARNIDFDKFRGKRKKDGSLKDGEVDRIDFYQPTTVEQLCEYIHTLSSIIPENRNADRPVCIHALDSVVALITDALEEEIDSNKMAYHARMYSQYLPIINGDIVKSGCTFLYTNQLRQKPGVKYGCLQGDSQIRLVDGRNFTIREIIENKIEGEVWSYVDNKLQPAKIINWFDNGESDPSDWVTIYTEGPGSKNGFFSITVTKNHQILKSSGEWVESKDLKVGDELVSKYEKTIEENSLAEQFLLGTLIGDSCIPNRSRNRNKDILILMNNEQPEYLNWKVEKLKDVLDFKHYTITSHVRNTTYEQYVSRPDICLGVLAKDIIKRDPSSVLDKLTWLSIAVWFMDDGNGDFNYGHFRGAIVFKRLRNNPEVLELIKNWFVDRDIEGKIAKDKCEINFGKDAFLKLSDKIAEYIPESMQYKLPESHRGRYKDFVLTKGTNHAPLPVKITKIKEGLGHKYNRKFDLEIEGSHNYLAGHKRGGLIVHNSPIYEPAGDALKFFSSIRLMLSTTKPKLDGDEHPFLTKEMIPGVEVREGGVWEEPHFNTKGEITGLDKYMYTGIKTVKNKVYTPYQSCWMRIHFEENGSTGSGLDPVFDVFTFFHETGYIKPLVVTQDNGKEKKVKGSYMAHPCKQFNPVKEFGMPQTFNYYDFKKWVNSRPDLVMCLRERLLVSGLIYEKEEEEPISVIVDDITDEELEEQGLAEVAQGLEEVKKRGRPKRKEG